MVRLPSNDFGRTTNDGILGFLDMDAKLIEAMKTKAFSLGHVFDEEAYKGSSLVEADAFFCIRCNELYVYFMDDNELIGGRAIGNPDQYGEESIVDVRCPVETLPS